MVLNIFLIRATKGLINNAMLRVSLLIICFEWNQQNNCYDNQLLSYSEHQIRGNAQGDEQAFNRILFSFQNINKNIYSTEN